MNDGIRKFRELLLTDEVFQQKLKAASEAYTGEMTEEAVFNNVLLPLGQEYGVSAEFEEFKAFIDRLGDQEMDADELQQIAGGGKGGGANLCFGIGVGLGGSDGDDGLVHDLCLGVGFGGTGACAGEGNSVI